MNFEQQYGMAMLKLAKKEGHRGRVPPSMGTLCAKGNARRDAMESRLLDFIESNPGCTQKQMAAHLEISVSNNNNYVGALWAKGKLERKKVKTKTFDGFHYTIAEEEKCLTM